MLPHPRLKVEINGGDPARKDALASRLLQLFLKDIIAAISLCLISLQRILILGRVVMSTVDLLLQGNFNGG
jgi:hypothetical protein